MLVLVTGGSGSGKSEYAENLAMKLAEIKNESGNSTGREPVVSPLCYIATMFPFDEECHKRIARHREMRKEKNFDTIECFTGLKQVILPPNATVLLECMSNLVANEIYQEAGAGDSTVSEVTAGIRSLKERCANLIIVSNEVFSDGITYEEETIRYQQFLGNINCIIAEEADEVTEIVYGIPVKHKRRQS